MLAHHGTGRSQLSQNDRGVTIEMSRGNRYATVTAKLPTHAPSASAATSPIIAGTCSIPSPPPPRTRPLSVKPRDTGHHDPFARAVELGQHHALPLAERKPALAHR